MTAVTMKSLLTVAAAALLVAATTSADAKPRKRHKAPKIVHVTPESEYEVIRQRYLLLYGGCVTDEGYGRFSPCDRAKPD
jgi:hypothetical protein